MRYLDIFYEKTGTKELCGHSNFSYKQCDLLPSGWKHSLDDQCYSQITYSEGMFSDIILFFQEDCEDWYDWVINKSAWAGAFITKNVKEGFSQGFVLDVTKPRYLVQAAMIIIRYHQELSAGNRGWCWPELVGMGYSETEAFALASSIKLDGDVFTIRCWSNHLVIQSMRHWKYYKGYNDVGDNPIYNQTPNTKYSDFTIALTGVYWGGDYIYAKATPDKIVHNQFGSTIQVYDFSIKNLNLILAQIKGE